MFLRETLHEWFTCMCKRILTHTNSLQVVAVGFIAITRSSTDVSWEPPSKTLLAYLNSSLTRICTSIFTGRLCLGIFPSCKSILPLKWLLSLDNLIRINRPSATLQNIFCSRLLLRLRERYTVSRTLTESSISTLEVSSVHPRAAETISSA